jgi:WD40 repeat protein
MFCFDLFVAVVVFVVFLTNQNWSILLLLSFVRSGKQEIIAPNATIYIVENQPQVELLEISPDPEKPDPKIGVCMSDWSHSDRYLCTRNENIPNALYIWDTQTLQLCSVIVQMLPIKHAKWDPKRDRLAFCSGNDKLYMWSAEGCSIITVPTNGFSVKSVQWSQDGLSALLLDRDHFVLCFLRQ